jgi:molybdate transport system permease protein
VVSTEIYGHVEAMEFAEAHTLALTMVVFALGVLWVLHTLERRGNRR